MNEIHVDTPYKELYKFLTIDCERCCGLCCVALYFSSTEGFPEDKPAGKACINMCSDFRCTVHDQLARRGLKGCLAYDCFGAGQRVYQDVYQSVNWMTDHEISDEMFSVFLTVRQLHQILWYLVEVSSIVYAKSIIVDVRDLILQNLEMTKLSSNEILGLDIQPYRLKANDILRTTGELVLRAEGENFENNKKTDYIGENMKGRNLHGRDFSMSLMIAADLEGCDLQGANFLGTDLRDANLRKADLRESIFLTQMQVNSAKGDRDTLLPYFIKRPESWT